MNNSKSQSPCLVAEYLHAPCEPRGNGNVSAIVDDTYRPPTAEGAEACGCSWALYNTLQACAVCQSDSNFAFSTNCSSQLKQNTEFYSSNEVISEQTAVQFWATRDTSMWDSGMFNSTQAEAIASECKEDITQENREAASGGVSASTSGSSTVSTEIGSPSNDKFSVNKKLAQEEPNMTILPLITPGFSEPQPMHQIYALTLRSPVHEANYAVSGENGRGNTLASVPSSNDVGLQPVPAFTESSPPPYTDMALSQHRRKRQ
ncbi:hypothetical protein ACEPAH_6274 [Sanghuangporus vaninii]